MPAALINRACYRVVCDVDVWYRQCNATMTVATTNASFLPGGTIEIVSVMADATNVVAITDGGSGYIWLTPLNV